MTGPCGPDSELFYDTGRPKHGPDCQPGCGCGKYIEIGNNVFLQYNKTAEGTYVPLKQRNIDVGIGLERTLCVHQRTSDIYTTDLFRPIVQRINTLRYFPWIRVCLCSLEVLRFQNMGAAVSDGVIKIIQTSLL